MKKCLIIVLFLSLIQLQIGVASEGTRIGVLSFTLPTSNILVKQLLSEGNLTAELIIQSFVNQGVLNNNPSFLEFEEAVKTNAGTILPAPFIGSIPGQTASLNMVSEVQYLEKTVDGILVTRDVEWANSPGLWLEFIVDKAETDNHFSLDYSILIRIITGRKEIPGVKLNVGEPEFKEFTSEHNPIVPWNEWVLLEAVEIPESGSDESNLLIILTKLSPA
ncbi:hypothetical protein K8T06_13860 [bacterium]|nr:hypothetical protein [bacterium]